VSRELGAFTEGLAHGEDSLRIAEAVNHPLSLVMPAMASAMSTSAKAHCTRHSVARTGPGGLQGLDLPFQSTSALRPSAYAYVLAGRVSDALPLLEQSISMEDTASRGAGVHAWLSEALSAPRPLDEALALALRGLRSPARRRNRVSSVGPAAPRRESTHTAIPRGRAREAAYRKLWPWPTRWACARSRRTPPRLGMLHGTPRQQEEPAASSRPPSRCTGPWT